jgi:hypothetical protein
LASYLKGVIEMGVLCSEYMGAFQVESGQLVVIDPAFSVGENKDVIVRNAKKGEWHAMVTRGKFGWWGEVVVSISAHAKEFCGERDAIKWEENAFFVRVDTGAAGVFDLKHYQVCNEVSECGVRPFGAVSRTGFGDGDYSCYVKTVNGEVVAILIECMDAESLVDHWTSAFTNGPL